MDAIKDVLPLDAIKDVLPLHPFYPLDLVFDNYVTNTWTITGILGVFFVACGAVMFTTHQLIRAFSPNMRKSDHACMLWFVVSGAIHLIVEGYFVYFNRTMPAREDWLGQAWKEYALSDSRYMFSDPTVLAVEGLAACLLGPGCLFTAYLIYTNSAWRHPIQVLTSWGQLYGVIIYYATNLLDFQYKGIEYSIPSWAYFWLFYFGLNAIWLVIPALCIYRSSVHTAHAFRFLKQTQGSQYGNGPANTTGNESVRKSQ